MNDTAPTPIEIQLKKLSHVVAITWSDGEVSQLTGATLRRYCACSGCRSRNVVGIQLINDSSNINAITAIGGTGLQIIFADGHDRGIFPFGYLHAIAKGEAETFLAQ